MSLTFGVDQSNYGSERQILVYPRYHYQRVLLDPYMHHTMIAETIPAMTQNAVSEDMLQ